MVNINQLNSAWKTSSHDERNQFINDFSIGSIDNSDSVGIELFKVEDEILKEAKVKAEKHIENIMEKKFNACPGEFCESCDYASICKWRSKNG